jgi:hypothetical protein
MDAADRTVSDRSGACCCLAKDNGSCRHHSIRNDNDGVANHDGIRIGANHDGIRIGADHDGIRIGADHDRIRIGANDNNNKQSVNTVQVLDDGNCLNRARLLCSPGFMTAGSSTGASRL